MKQLEEKLGYSFKNTQLLQTALTHSSYANEIKKSSVVSNERLEFLGDSVLGMIVARHLYDTYPDMQGGKMTKMRSELVCEQSLALVAEKLDLGYYLRLGKGEIQSGGSQRPSILADAVEAILAAVTLDGGLKCAQKIIDKHILSNIEGLTKKNRDYKTLIQEQVQKKSGRTFAYRLVDQSGPDHMKEFTVEILIDEKPVGIGKGRTKKEAEQMAAAIALERQDSWDRQ